MISPRQATPPQVPELARDLLRRPSLPRPGGFFFRGTGAELRAWCQQLRNDQPMNQPTLEDLATELEQAKANAAAARERQLEIEQAILAHPDVAPALRESGTTNVGPIKIVTGHTRKWDQKKLEETRAQVDPRYWPFKTEHKEDAAASKVMAASFPDLWDLIRPALTLTPRKPAISIHRPKG